MADAHALRKELGLRDLVLFNLAAILSTRWIAAAAHVGPASLLLWVAAAVLFLIPSALVVAHLSRLYPAEGGLYVWTREAFGEWHGFACAWFYYLNNLFWIPGALVALIGMTIYSFDANGARIAEDARIIVPCSLAVLALIVGVNYIGLRFAKWVDNFGALGVYGVAGILFVASAIALMHFRPATRLRTGTSFSWDTVNFWSQLAFGMTGLELSPILSGEIRNPQRTIYRAAWIGAGLVVLYYVVGTASILVFLKPEQVSPVIGLAGAAQAASQLLGWTWVPFAIAVCILLSTGGQLGTYVGACARLPFVLGIGNMLPGAFAKLHPRYQTPYLSILFLGFGTGLLLIISQLGETFRAAYQITVDMTVITLFIPFLYIFAAAWKFRQRLAAVCGLAVSILAIALSFIPTADVRSVWSFEAKLWGGCIVLFVLGWMCYRHYRTAR